MTHTHYDHIGALPFFRKEWPNVQTLSSATGAAVLLKDTPRRVIRELSLVAAETNGVVVDATYSDDAYQTDIIIKEGDRIDLGGITVEVLETPGHTRDALSFYIPELELLILNETMGVLMPDGNVYPCYLTSFKDTMNAIEKCRKIPYRFLSMPHQSIVNSEAADGFFEKAKAANQDCRDFIMTMHANGLNETEILAAFDERYGSDLLLAYQPKEAFFANARATIACTLR
jgi:flavorubredoxin